jgi:hypothetical protein
MVAYERAHPEALARYGVPKTQEEDMEETYQLAVWSLTTSPWNSPEMQQHQSEEREQVHSATQAEQVRFFAAKNAAIVQLAYGEHE